MTVPRVAAALWCALAAVAAFAYAYVVRDADARIAASDAARLSFTARLDAAGRLLASARTIEATRDALRARLPAADLPVVRFLRRAAAVTRRRATTIATLAASPPLAGVPPEAVALDLTIEGRYTAVLATLRELSSADVPASVRVVSVARNDAGGADAVVSAALHVALEP